MFGKYETSLVKKLMKKFTELKIKDAENLDGGQFCKAVFLLQEEVQSDLTMKLMEKKAEEERKAIKNALDAKESPTRIFEKNKDLNTALEAEKGVFLKETGTLGRSALREENEYLNMYTLDTRDPSLLMQIDRRDLMKDLANLDQIIYKEGRMLRNRQSLQDSMLSKVKEISDSYDNLYYLVELMTKRYKELCKESE